MKSRMRPLGWICGRRLRVASAALAILLLSGFTEIGWAQGPPTYSVLYSFTGTADGARPFAGVIADAAGNLYGTTESGGAYGYGVVFKLNPIGRETVLYAFTGGADGANPQASLIRDAAGNLYGTTVYGGDTSCDALYGCGTVFKVDALGNETTLYTFTGGTDGAYPLGGVIRDTAGNLYGTTYEGGGTSCYQHGCGVVFKLDESGKETVLYSFMGGTDGAYPYAGLIGDAAGNLYGTTAGGGDTSRCGGAGCGTVFEVDALGDESTLYSFTNGTDGEAPHAGVIRDAAGNLYGTTLQGGGGGWGVVFELDVSGIETTLHGFAHRSDGGFPYAGLILDGAGDLYGTTGYGGDYGKGAGVVFKLDASGHGTALYTFTGGTDGAVPYGGVTRDTAGNLYGTTSGGGAYGYGVVFKLSRK